MNMFRRDGRSVMVWMVMTLALCSFQMLQAEESIVLGEAGGSEFYIGERSGEVTRLALGVGQSTVLEGTGVTKAFVSNPDVLKVNSAVIRGKSYMVLTAKKSGNCDIVRFGKKSPLPKISVRVFEVTTDAKALKSEIERILPGSDVEVVSEENGLRLKGYVRDKQEMDLLVRQLSRYSNTIRNEVVIGKKKQIRLEAKIVEMSRTKLKEAGINLLGIGSDATAGIFTSSSLTGYAAGRGVFTDVTSTSPFSEAFQLLLGIGDISSVLSILESKGITKTLSNPSVTTANEKPAKLFVGGSIPVPVPQTGSNVVTIEWKEYGIKLDFVPHVTKNESIALKVLAEAGDLSSDKGVSIGGTTVPAVNTRRIDSEVTLRDGEELVIGGLMFSKDQNAVDAVPLLGDIPIIGAFFSKVRDSREELELIVLIKAHFVASDEEESGYEERFKSSGPMEWSDYLLGRADDRIE